MNIRKLIAVITVAGAFASSSFAGVTNIYSSGYTDLGTGIYYGGGQNSYLVVSNSAVLVSTATILGYNAADGYASAVVTGNNSTWSNNPSYIIVGYDAAAGSNSITVSNGGRLIQTNTSSYLSIGYISAGNKLTVTGANSMVNSGELYIGGNSGGANELLISDGGVVITPRTWFGNSSSDNRLTVTGPNSVLSNTAVAVLPWGYYGSRNEAVISNGGTIQSGYQLYVGNAASSASNSVTVTGAGSVFRVPADVALNKGHSSKITISDGGRMESSTGYIGNDASATNLSVTITGTNSTWQMSDKLVVGQNGYSTGSGRVLIENGGVLEAGKLYSGTSGSGIISNRNGIFQFATATPTIVNNDVAGNSIVSQDGTISFRGIANAPTAIGGTALTNIAFQGNTGYRLNNATNTSISDYTFNTGNPTNYQRLELANGGRWQSATLTIGSGGALLGNGTVASGVATNLGLISPGFSPGLITFTNDLVLGSTSMLQMEIGGTHPTNFDRLIVGGSLTLGGGLDIEQINSFSPAVGDSFLLIDAQAISGQFAGLTNNQFIDASGNGMTAYYRIQYDSGNGDVLLLATIPEPSTLLLVMAAAGVMSFRRHG